jgi:hypothetical protein
VTAGKMTAARREVTQRRRRSTDGLRGSSYDRYRRLQGRLSGRSNEINRRPIAGIQPAAKPSLSVNLEICAGYVINLSDDPPSAMRTIPHV